MAESLKNKTVNGVAWSGVERFSVQGIQFIVTLVIARILSPKEYGLIGMLAIFLGVAQSLIDSGFSQALIRKQNRTEVDNSTVFYFNIIASFIIYAILYIIASSVASFYREPELCDILKVLGIVVVINSFAVVQRALFTIHINFKVQTKATLVAAILSGGVGIVMALNGLGVWALVYQQISNAFICTLLLWYYSKWRPAIAFSRASFCQMFGYGSKLMLSGLINTAYNNIYQITIGKIFNAASLGYYTRAGQFAHAPANAFTEVIQRVMFPVMCKIQEDKTKYKEVFSKSLRIAMFLIAPFMCLMAGISRPMILILLGDKWLYAASLLVPICFSTMLLPMHALNLNAITVIGRSDLFLRVEIYKKIVGVLVMVCAIPLGVLGMCYAGIIGSVVGLLINAQYSKKEIGYGLVEQLKDISGTMMLSLIVFVTTYFVSRIFPNLWMALISAVLVGIVLFVSLCYIFKFEELDYLKSIKR